MKLRIKIFLYASLLLVSCFSYGQEKVLHGTITNSKDVEGIHILNTSSRFNSVTNATGLFSITVKPLDTLLVSSVHYMPEQIVVSSNTYEKGTLTITLRDLINELDEVFLGPRLSGDLERDIKTIKTEDQINFDDVGIPGFKGKAEEKIPRVLGQVITPVSVDVEGLYKHLSGYYRKLKLQRKWEAQNLVVSQIIHRYTPAFFEESFQIPQERLYDFLLFCMETTDLKNRYLAENFSIVINIFTTQSKLYTLRLEKKEE